VHVQVVASAHSESSTTTAASGDGGTNLAGSEAEDSGPTRCPRFLEDGSSKLVVCAVRKPLRMIKSRKGDAWAYRRSQSGFNSSIDFIASENRVQWVAWAGAYVEPGTREAVRRQLVINCHYTSFLPSFLCYILFLHAFSSGVHLDFLPCLAARDSCELSVLLVYSTLLN
jgi:hypothetical protein